MTDLPVPSDDKRVVVVLERLEALLIKSQAILERFEAKYLKLQKLTEVTPMPDVTSYGLWDCEDISGIWGTGSHYKISRLHVQLQLSQAIEHNHLPRVHPVAPPEPEEPQLLDDWELRGSVSQRGTNQNE